MGFKVETNEIIDGYSVVIIATDMGHRCGYVGVDITSKYYGKCYDDIDDIECHGGLTFTDYSQIKEIALDNTKNTLWYLGFDCAHYGDLRDPTITDPKYAEMMDFGDGTIKTNQFCLDECKKIIKQLGDNK